MGEYRGSCGVQLGPDADSAIDLRVNLWWKSIGLPFHHIGIKLIKSILGIFPDRSARRDILRHDPSGAGSCYDLQLFSHGGPLSHQSCQVDCRT